MNYRKLFEEYHGYELADGMEIHHKDGNHSNNDIGNLQAVSIEEHFDIHLRQGDVGACTAILMRMKTDKYQLCDFARETQLRLLDEGKHNFQNISSERRTEISRKGIETTRKMEKGFFSKGAHRSKTSKIAGIAARDKKAGFHDPTKTGGVFVRNTYWWTNIKTGERKRSKDKPEGDWKRGMKQ